MEFYFNAFQELQSERQMGMSAGQIPWSRIISWADFHGLRDKDEIDVLINHVRSLESEARKHETKDEKGK